MKVLSGKDYGYRKVVRVLMNDSDPEWIHPDGKKVPLTHTGDTEVIGKTLCLKCLSNWDVKEFQFEGDGLLKEVEISPAIPATPATEIEEAKLAIKAVTEMQPKTDAEILDEALEFAAVSFLVRDMVV